MIMLCWVFFTIQSNAQSHIFSGKVQSSDGKPLTGANVYIDNSYYGTITDTKGDFVFNKFPEGSYVLKISYIGYETHSEEIFISSDLYREFYLFPANIMGEEVIVRALRAHQKDPVAFTNLSAEDISRLNNGRDIPYLLSLTPSLVPTSDAGTGIGYTGFRIRGTDASRINITMNGVPLNDSESHGVWWVNMPDFASSVQNMQIQRGVGTSSNGAAAFGASVNIQTLSLNNEPYAEFSSSLGSFNTRKSNVAVGTGLINDRLNLDMRLSTIYSDGYIDRAFSDLKSYYVSAGWHTAASRIKFITFSGNERTYQAWDGVPGDILDTARTYNGIGKYLNESGKVSYYDNETDNYKQKHYQFHFLKEFSPDLYLNAIAHYTKGLGYYEQYKENRKLSDYQIPDIIIGSDVIKRTDIVRRKWLNNDFYGTVFSLIYRRNRMESILGGAYNIYDGDHYGDVIWARNAGITEINHRWYENAGMKNDYNLYTRFNFIFAENIRTFTDFQVRGINYRIIGIDDDLIDISQKHNFLFFNPKIGLNYDLSGNDQLYLSFSVANREPNRSNFKDSKKGDPVPRHETLYDYEAGYKHRRQNWLFDVNFYYMDYNNQLVLTGEINNVGDPVMKNVKDSYRTGCEIISSFNISRNLRWDFNLTLSRNKIKNMNIYVDNWDYWNDPDNEPLQYSFPKRSSNISFSPPVIAGNIFAIKASQDLSVEIHSKYVGKQYIDNSESVERMIDPYFINDLMLFYSRKLKNVKQLDVSLSLINIFNQKYISNAWVYRYFEDKEEKRLDGYFPQAGIHFLAGLTLKF